MEEAKDISNWLDRLKDEEKQLHTKMIALGKALKENKIPSDEVGMLELQLSSMTTYAYVLKLRLDKHNK